MYKRIMKKYVLFFLIMIGLSITSLSLSLNDINFDQRIDGEGGFKEYTIENKGSKRLRYRIRVHKGEKNDMSKWIEVYPKVLTIEPFSKGKMKVFAKAPEGTPEGSYNFSIMYDNIIIPTLSKTEGKTISGGATLGIKPIIEMRGYVGEIDFSKAINFENIVIKKNSEGKIELETTVENTSHSGIVVGLYFKDKNKNIIGWRSLGRVPANISKTIKIGLEEVKNIKEIREILLFNSDNDTIKTYEIKNGKLN